MPDPSVQAALNELRNLDPTDPEVKALHTRIVAVLQAMHLGERRQRRSGTAGAGTTPPEGEDTGTEQQGTPQGEPHQTDEATRKRGFQNWGTRRTANDNGETHQEGGHGSSSKNRWGTRR